MALRDFQMTIEEAYPGMNSKFVGREHEMSKLEQLAKNALAGRGKLVLVAGEAGIGKSRLVEEYLTQSGMPVLQGRSAQEGTPAYGPIVEVLRSYLRLDPGSATRWGPLAGHLAVLLPELGQAPAAGDRATLFEAIRSALGAVAQVQPMAVFLDDLQWADSATLEVCSTLAAWVQQQPLLIIVAYRSDEVPRGHPIRRLRTDLRRAGKDYEITVGPLTALETAALTESVLGQQAAPALAAKMHTISQGFPLFIEELSSAIADSEHLVQTGEGIGLNVGGDIPIPDTLKDIIRLRAERLSAAAKNALEVAAVMGPRFELDTIAGLGAEEHGLEEAIERGLIVEIGAGQAAFRHDLIREAVYGDIPWLRRRLLHKQVASLLQGPNIQPMEIAEHWLAAREFERARHALLGAAERSCSVYAYRDAGRAARRALEIWPDGQAEAERLQVMDRLGECAQLCGEFSDAARSWREVAEGYRSAGDLLKAAETERRLAVVYELQGLGEKALEARREAADAFDSAGLHAEAAAERISIAEHFEQAGRLRMALDLAKKAVEEGALEGRVDLQILALGLQGQVTAELGDVEEGKDIIKAGLALALDNSITGLAAYCYYKLATVFDIASDYRGATEAYTSAIDFCQRNGILEIEQVCLACFAVVLRQTGDWERAAALCREVLASEGVPVGARAIALGMLGSIQAFRGMDSRAKGLLLEAQALAQQNRIVSLEIDTNWNLAVLDDRHGDLELAAERCRIILARWEDSEDLHYAIPPLRWAASFFAANHDATYARACSKALATLAASTGNPEALAALAHSLGECALQDGNAPQAVIHFNHSLEVAARVDIPLSRAQTQVRVAQSLIICGDKEEACERLTEAYRTARQLGARPLAASIVREMASLGEQIERRLGRRAISYIDGVRLSSRELEVLQMVSRGKTNREIGHDLFLSHRTVEMHVSNILGKLGCSSRAEAVHKAHEVRLLT